jgi:hypothetical protein
MSETEQENEEPNTEPMPKKSRKKTPLTPDEKYDAKIKRKKIRIFKATIIQTPILITIFDDETVEQNRKYRTSKKMELIPKGCIYCSPTLVAEYIPINTFMYVIEMNNDKNKIIAIGKVRNKSHFQKFTVYQDRSYNQYQYIGKWRIPREEFTEDEETIAKIIDILCFTGNGHMKRSYGLKTFPIEILYDLLKNPVSVYKQNRRFANMEMDYEMSIDLVKFIKNMFDTRNYI